MHRYWLSRLILASWTLMLPLVTWLEPDSLTGRVLAATGPMGMACMVLMLSLSLLAIADVAVNDLLPDAYHLRIKHHRHLGFMALAIACTLVSGVIAVKHGFTGLLLAYWLPALYAVLITFLDLTARHRSC